MCACVCFLQMCQWYQSLPSLWSLTSVVGQGSPAPSLPLCGLLIMHCTEIITQLGQAQNPEERRPFCLVMTVFAPHSTKQTTSPQQLPTTVPGSLARFHSLSLSLSSSGPYVCNRDRVVWERSMLGQIPVIPPPPLHTHTHICLSVLCMSCLIPGSDLRPGALLMSVTVYPIPQTDSQCTHYHQQIHRQLSSSATLVPSRVCEYFQDRTVWSLADGFNFKLVMSVCYQVCYYQKANA